MAIDANIHFFTGAGMWRVFCHAHIFVCAKKAFDKMNHVNLKKPRYLVGALMFCLTIILCDK